MARDEFILKMKSLNDDELTEQLKMLIIKSHFDYAMPKWKREALDEICNERSPEIYERAVFEAYNYIDIIEPAFLGLSTYSPIQYEELSDKESRRINSNLSRFVDRQVTGLADESVNIFDLMGIKKENLLFARIKGNSMIEANINESDIIAVDISGKPVDGQIVLVTYRDDIIIKRLKIIKGDIYLVAENREIEPFKLELSSEFSIIGIVKYYIKNAE